jgi:hypothetical protein
MTVSSKWDALCSKHYYLARNIFQGVENNLEITDAIKKEVDGRSYDAYTFGDEEIDDFFREAFPYVYEEDYEFF